jgi:hypothetical protein
MHSPSRVYYDFYGPHPLRSPASKVRISRRAPVREKACLRRVSSTHPLCYRNQPFRRRGSGQIGRQPPSNAATAKDPPAALLCQQRRGPPTLGPLWRRGGSDEPKICHRFGRKFFAFRSSLFRIRCLWVCLAVIYLSLDVYGSALPSSIYH